MKTTRRLALATLGGGGVIVGAARGIAATEDAPPDDILREMLTATAGAKYADFLKYADDAFKAALTKQNFDGVAAQLSPRLKGGHTVAFLGRLRQGGHDVFLMNLSSPPEVAYSSLVVLNVGPISPTSSPM